MEKYIQCLFTSQELDNNGSIARDNLANERTFLAWIRTGLGTAALGVLLVRLQADSGDDGNLKTGSKIVGFCLVFLAVFFTVAGVIRYVNVSYMLGKDKYPTPGIMVALLSFFTAAVLVGIIVIIFI